MIEQQTARTYETGPRYGQLHEDNLGRFEDARRLLGHAATVDREVVANPRFYREEVNAYNSPHQPSEVMLSYAEKVNQVRAEHSRPNRPAPVAPAIEDILDPVSFASERPVVEHTTCTGNTTISVVNTAEGPVFRINRHSEPLSPDYGRDVALGLLADEVIQDPDHQQPATEQQEILPFWMDRNANPIGVKEAVFALTKAGYADAEIERLLDQGQVGEDLVSTQVIWEKTEQKVVAMEASNGTESEEYYNLKNILAQRDGNNQRYRNGA